MTSSLLTACYLLLTTIMLLPHHTLQTYHYHLDIGRYHDPLRVRYSHHCKRPLDLDSMRAAAALLVGTHDFTQFSNESKERLKRNPVKTLERLDIVQERPAAVHLEVRQ